MEPGDPDLISSDISLILISSIQLSPGAPDLSLFGIPVLAGRLVFAVSWQTLGEHAGWERSPGGGTGRQPLAGLGRRQVLAASFSPAPTAEGQAGRPAPSPTPEETPRGCE